MSRARPSNTPIEHARWASVAEVASYIGASEKTVYRHVWAGELPARRLGKKMLRIDLNDVDALLRPVNAQVAS